MSVDRRLVNLGVFLLVLGAIPLAVSQGWIARETISHAWDLWPLILIGIGIGLILRRTPVHFVGGLLVALTFGTIFGAVLAGGLSIGAFACANAAAADAPVLLDGHGTFTGATNDVSVRATCANLAIAPGPGGSWGVTVSGPDQARPALDQAADRLEVRSPDRFEGIPFGEGRRSSWALTLGTGVTYSLDLNLNAGEATIDLAGVRVDRLNAQGNAAGSKLLLHDATVGRLDAQVNAGSLRIALPAGADLSGQIQANLGSISLCADPGIGLRLRNSSTVTGDNFAAAGLVRSGTTWETPGIASATHVVDLALQGTAASFTLNPSEGCR
jgi:hypothetical protein